MSVFLGDELTEILKAIESQSGYSKKEKVEMELGVDVLPHFPKDTTDRNRTSPFAFTGNKFEFRMLGSTFSIAGPNIVLNTIVAEELRGFADILENASDFKAEFNQLIVKTIKEHKRIIFNGNNYTEEWVEEAEKRGLLNLKTTPEALPLFVSEKNIRLFTSHGIFTETEMRSRLEILLENYVKTITIEALTMAEMVKKDILPSVLAYTRELSDTALSKKALSEDISVDTELDIVRRLSALAACMRADTEKLESAIVESKNFTDASEQAKFCRETIFVAMQQLRAVVDEAECLVSEEYWPFPTYGELLYNV